MQPISFDFQLYFVTLTSMKLNMIIFSVLSITLLGCSHLFYYPSTRLYTKPSELENPPTVQMIASGEDQISVWHFKPKNKQPKAKIIFFHGNAENLSTHFMGLYWMLDEGYEFAIFDYPGYGASTGKPTRKSTTDAGRAVLRWYSQQSPELPLVVYGQSLGGNIALYSAEQERAVSPCLVAVESTFKSYRTVARRAASKHWLTWPLQPLAYLLVSNGYSGGDFLDKLPPTPLLVIHGDSDPVVDEVNGRELFAAASEPKEYWSVPGGQHIFSFFGKDREVYRKRFLQTLEEKCGVRKAPSK